MPMSMIETLRLAMEAAAAAMDFEEASRLRDQISLLRASGGAGNVEDIDPTGLDRQRPGAMGLGTSQQRVTPPPGWIRPAKPDLRTNGSKKGRSKKTP